MTYDIFLSAVLSLIIAFLVVKLAYKGDTEKLVYSAREKLYAGFYSEFDRMLSDRTLIFDSGYTEKMGQYRARMNLMASSEVISAYDDIMRFISDIAGKYGDFAEMNDPQKKGDQTERKDMIEFETKKNMYTYENQPPQDILQGFLDTIAAEMREDLGSDRSRISSIIRRKIKK